MKTVNFARMAHAEGITVSVIGSALGVPIPVITLETIRDAYYRSTDPVEKRCHLALWIDLCITPEEAREAYDSFVDDPELEARAMTRWETCCFAVLANALAPTEARTVFRNAPHHSAVRTQALRTWIDLCTTLPEVRDAYRHAASGSPEAQLAMKRWRDFSYEAITAATTPAEAQLAYRNAPEKSPEATKAMAVWRRLSCEAIAAAKTATEAMVAFQDAPPNTQEQQFGCEKWDAFAICEVAEATTQAAIRAAFQVSPRNSRAATLAIRKLAFFYLE